MPETIANIQQLNDLPTFYTIPKHIKRVIDGLLSFGWVGSDVANGTAKKAIEYIIKQVDADIGYLATLHTIFYRLHGECC